MDFSDQFPVLGRCTYLNTAGSGILSRDLSAWRNEHDQEYLLTGSGFRLTKDEFLQAGRKTIADFFNGDSDHTYLVPNFSFGFSVLLDGLKGPKRFLLFKDDYPSISYPVESRGYECAYVQVNEFLEQNILETIERFDPDVLAFSLVQYSNGIKIDLEFLSRLKETYPRLLIVADGTQFCGTACFDFKRSGIDVLIASGYKWLLGGYGNGFVLLTAYAVDLLYTNQKNMPLPAQGFLKGRDALSLYFEPGHIDTLSFGTLFRAVTYLQKQGIAEIENKVKQLAMKARAGFTARHLLSAAVTGRKDHSSIFDLMLPAGMISELQREHFVFTNRGVGMRVSFHFYNTEIDLEKLLEAIDKLLY